MSESLAFPVTTVFFITPNETKVRADVYTHRSWREGMWENIASFTSEKVPLMRLLVGWKWQWNSDHLTTSSGGMLRHRIADKASVHASSGVAVLQVEWPLKDAYSEVMSLGLILGTYGEPTQMMDSREQLHVDGQRQAFLGTPGRARRHSNTDTSTHWKVFTGGCMVRGREALLRRAGRCAAVSARGDGRGGEKKVPHWLPSRRQRIRSRISSSPDPSTHPH